MYPGDLVKCEPRNRRYHALNGAIGLLIEYHVPAGGPGFIMRDRWRVLIDGQLHTFWINELKLISGSHLVERS